MRTYITYHDSWSFSPAPTETQLLQVAGLPTVLYSAAAAAVPTKEVREAYRREKIVGEALTRSGGGAYCAVVSSR